MLDIFAGVGGSIFFSGAIVGGVIMHKKRKQAIKCAYPVLIVLTACHHLLMMVPVILLRTKKIINKEVGLLKPLDMFLFKYSLVETKYWYYGTSPHQIKMFCTKDMI